MKQILSILLLFLTATASAQENVYPAPRQAQPIVISGGTVHTGTGQVLQNTSLLIVDGKITQIGTNITAPAGAKTIDARGRHVYPALINSISNLGLVEVPSVRATNDLTEIGVINPSIRSLVAYNTDSRVLNPVRSQGTLFAHVVPQGGLISGTSSVVHLDAWNWEDAAYKADNGIHFYMPSLIPRPATFRTIAVPQPEEDVVRRGLQQVDEIKGFFREAKAYGATTPAQANLKFEAVKGLFNRSQKLFVHAQTVKQMLVAIDFVREFDFDVVIVGGMDSWQIADLLKQNNIAVILHQVHRLPTLADDDVDQPFKTPAMLQRAGVLFAIADVDGNTRGRNLPFNAGTAAAYGLTKEQALQTITLNVARILGMADRTGSLEVGKDANIIISAGDVLDMRHSIITNAFIQGRQLVLDDKQQQLYERYRHKYGLK